MVQPTPERDAEFWDSEPKGHSGWRNVRRGMGAGVVLVLLASIGYTVWVVGQVARMSASPWSPAGLPSTVDGRSNILLLGTGDAGHAGEKLTDTIIVLSESSQFERNAIVSVPRDLRVLIPGRGLAKINSANVYGGTTLATEVVSTTLDEPIHGVITTTFDGLVSVVDAVGGIDVDVPKRLSDPEYPCDNDQYKSCGWTLEAGRHHLTGAEALKYARCRKGTCGNDFGRAERQQEVIDVVKEKLGRPGFWVNPVRVAKLSDGLSQSVRTDLGLVALAQFGWNWLRYSQAQPVSELVLATGNDGLLVSSGVSDLVPAAGDFSVIRRRIDDIFTTPISASEP